MVTIGLLTNRVDSPNYGVNALGISNLMLIEKNMQCLGIGHEYILFGFNQETKEIVNQLKERIELLKEITIRFVSELELRKIESFFEMIKNIKKCDVVFDTSGGDSYSDIYGNNRILHQVLPKLITLVLRKDLVFTPQTIGPFKSTIWREVCGRIMEKSVAIFARDNISYRIVKDDLKIKNVYNVTDMAMVLPYDKQKNRFSDSKLCVGLNISGLLYNGGYTRTNQFHIKCHYGLLIRKLIVMMIEEFLCEVHLIPHVVTTGVESDSDICDLLKKEYPKVKYEKKLNGPIETKSYIATMDLFIGARMHSTIAAISSGVPVIPLSYSRKFEGLFNSIDYHECIDLRENSENDVLETIRNRIGELDILKNEVQHSRNIIEQKMNIFNKALRDILEKYTDERC